MNAFVTSDQHFGHEKIIDYAHRPFSSLEEMNLAMVEGWNAVVGDEDLVWHLGDLFWTPEAAREFGPMLKGSINLLNMPWHHDGHWLFEVDQAEIPNIRLVSPIQVTAWREYSRDGKHPLFVTMTHFPMEEWQASYHGGIHIHGHTHTPGLGHGPHRFNVCVDATGFVPLNIESIFELDTRWWAEE